MFVHSESLEYLLRPEHYASEAFQRLEVERLFEPGWHFAGCLSEVPNEGDFFTLDLLGRPVLVRRWQGEVHAFLNVCSHRHALLTHEARGNSPTLRCQYHGWEYRPDGKTTKIPDARIFRPFDRERATLKKFRCETLGDLIFVSLADAPPPLAEWLGPEAATYADWFRRDAGYRLAWSWDVEFPCNWKIPVENTLESYHVTALHPTTLKNYPDEPSVEHRLHPRYTSHDCDVALPEYRRQNAMVSRRLGSPLTHLYRHHHVHPHTTLTAHDIYLIAQSIWPVSPRRSAMRLRYYVYRGERRGPLARAFGFVLKRFLIRATKSIFAEDASVFADLQKGIENSCYPGIIGTREERIHAFQRYVLDETGRPPAAGPSPKPPEGAACSGCGDVPHRILACDGTGR